MSLIFLIELLKLTFFMTFYFIEMEMYFDSTVHYEAVDFYVMINQYTVGMNNPSYSLNRAGLWRVVYLQWSLDKARLLYLYSFIYIAPFRTRGGITLKPNYFCRHVTKPLRNKLKIYISTCTTLHRNLSMTSTLNCIISVKEPH